MVQPSMWTAALRTLGSARSLLNRGVCWGREGLRAVWLRSEPWQARQRAHLPAGAMVAAGRREVKRRRSHPQQLPVSARLHRSGRAADPIGGNSGRRAQGTWFGLDRHGRPRGQPVLRQLTHEWHQLGTSPVTLLAQTPRLRPRRAGSSRRRLLRLPLGSRLQVPTHVDPVLLEVGGHLALGVRVHRGEAVAGVDGVRPGRRSGGSPGAGGSSRWCVRGQPLARTTPRRARSGGRPGARTCDGSARRRAATGSRRPSLPAVRHRSRAARHRPAADRSRARPGRSRSWCRC